MKYSPDNSPRSANSSSDSNQPAASNESPKSMMETFCKQMLKTRVFLGNFKEKRYVEALKTYRDIILLNQSEREIQKDMDIVRSRVLSFYDKYYHDSALWVGYSSGGGDVPATSCTIWTELDDSENIPFGQYWFQIKTVRFRHNEVLFKLTVLRPALTSDTHQTQSDTTLPTFDEIREQIANYDMNKTIDEFNTLFQLWKIRIAEAILWFSKEKITGSNILGLFRLLAIFLLNVVKLTLELVKNTGEYTLRFMVELRKLIKVLMPLLMFMMNLLNKFIGATFILLAMIWKDCFGSNRSRRNSAPRPEGIMFRSNPNRNYLY